MCFSATFLGGFLLIGFCICSSPLDGFALKGQSRNVESFMGNADHNFYPLSMPWTMPMAYPSSVCPNPAEANKSLPANQRFNVTTSNETFPSSSGSSKVAGTKRPHFSANIPKLQVDKDAASQFDVWGFSSESPLASTLTEDDFLDMVVIFASPFQFLSFPKKKIIILFI